MSKNKNFLGIDIGTSSLKVVEVSNEDGRAKLLTYGYSEKKILIFGKKPDFKVIGKELADLCKEAGVESKSAITGLPISDVFTTLFTFEKIPDKELKQRVEEKTRALAPIPEDELTIDWKKVPGKPEDKMIRVSVTAASKKIINNYVEIFKSAGLELLNLETEGLAMIRSLLGKDRALSLIVDIGAFKTNILLIKDGVPLIHKSVKVGGVNLTETLSARLGISKDKAEEIKRGLYREKMSGLTSILEELISPIVNEIKYAKSFYNEQYKNGIIEKMILTGGSSVVPGIGDSLEKAVGIKTFLGDPWSRIIYNDELRPVLDKLGPRFSVAIGLALRDMV